MTQAKFINIAIIKCTSYTTGLDMSVIPLFTPPKGLLCLIVTSVSMNPILLLFTGRDVRWAIGS